MNVFYGELAAWWPLISPIDAYEEEAEVIRAVLERRRPRAARLLELGSGGGHVAWYLKQRYACTLTDVSAAMLEVSAAANPECDHVVGDMRDLELGRTFDVVFAHDAIDYMLTERDLAAVFATAHRHLAPGGLALFVPDHVAERYEPATDSGGSDAEDGRGARYLEWSEPHDPTQTSAVVHYSFLLRGPDGAVQTRYERHEFGLFPRRTWTDLMEAAGFSVEVIEEATEEDRPPRLLFVGHKGSAP
jgi:SAM-dependent methyltransferase